MNPLWPIALIALAALLFVFVSRQRRRTGLPPGRVVYQDTSDRGEREEILYSARYHLAGRPDYLVRQGQYVIPVEVKSGRAPRQPYRSHVMQLAAYCLLVAETTGARPPYGVLRYDDRAFQIEYSRRLEESLLETLEEMRTQLEYGEEAHRSHKQPRRCARCGYRYECEEALA